VPAKAQDTGVVAAVTTQATTKSVIPVVQLPDSSEEFGDSRDIDPTAAASAADKIAEFTSACEEVLDEGTSEGPHHGAIIQSGVPLEFLHDEREEEAVWQAQIEAGSQIPNQLDRALELHRTTDYQISQVSGSLPGIVRILALISFVLPTPFLLQWLRDISRKKRAEMTRLYSQVRWLGQHNAGLVLQNIDANTKMANQGARQQALE